ncbi:uncharacterized protein PRCAT00000738001 [Priceomyces carsonii]|uniref:uncharacterized protein n=1 Tax=Priceomyces carsonii TaxID=28549 RepID=UPI002ED8920F|nr:unnamed protein product [Priceomyces carsonii]
MTTLAPQRSGQSYDNGSCGSSVNVDKVVQSVTNATKRLSQISTNTNSSNQKRTHSRIGPWKLGRTLGRGSTGRVRLAKNVDTGKLAAIKIVPKSKFKKLENPKYKRDSLNNKGLPYGIEREIIIMKLISHPNIMGLYDVWENKNDLYLILEYIEGGELFDYLIKKGRLQEFEAVSYFKQIINGIGYLHQFNICHRDLKPENLLLDFNKSIKIADFGMAALEVGEKLLETSCGSPHYASPEIVAGKTYHGAPSDIWSCGIILFALLTGHLPFDDENIRMLLLKVQNGKYILPPDLSWEAKDLISKMLKVNPEDRITIKEILVHPLMVKYPEPPIASTSSKAKNLQSPKVIPGEAIEKIDKEILKNLSVLFHNCSEQSIVSKLLSKDKCPEKMFYFMLLKYRNEHSSAHMNYDENDTDFSFTDSKVTIPRSTSIVKTTVIDPKTGDKHTTIKKIPRSTSGNSNKSSKNLKGERVLSNITNAPNGSLRNFKASNSFNKKKTLLHNQVISTPSAKSAQKKTKSNSPPKQQQPDVPPKIKRRPTGLSGLDDVAFNTTDVEERSTAGDSMSKETQQQKVEHQLRALKLAGSFGNKSLLNFELICLEVFGETKTLKTLSNEPNKLSKEVPRLSTENKGGLSEFIKHERELAAKVRRINEERDIKFKQEKEKTEKLRKENELKRKKEQELQNEKLRLLQAEALSKLKSQQDLNEQSVRTSRRHVTEPISSSLDPKAGSNSLLRAKSLAASHNPRLNQNTSNVLRQLGIDVKPPMSSSHQPPIKTSSSRNLSKYLHADATNDSSLEKIEVEKENFSLDEFNRKEGSSSTILKPLPDTVKKDHNTTYRSLLSDINENNANSFDDTSIMSNTFNRKRTSNNDLIPNPRFSKMSFGGLLNTSKYDIGDITIMNNLGTSAGTVVRKTVEKPDASHTTNRKSVVSLSGLGINVPETKKESSLDHNDVSEYNETWAKSDFYSVALSDSKDVTSVHISNLQRDAIDNHGEGKFDGMDDSDDSISTVLQDKENQNLQTGYMESDISNIDIISSTTAEVGHSNKTRPSLVEHNESSRAFSSESKSDESIEVLYKNYGNFYEEPQMKYGLTKPLKGKEAKSPDSQSSAHSEGPFSFKESATLEGSDAATLDGDIVSHPSDNVSPSKQSEKMVDQEDDKQLNEARIKKATSSRIFGSIVSADHSPEIDIKNDAEGSPNAAELSPTSPSTAGHPMSIIEDTHGNSLLKRLSLIPKRHAPKPPQQRLSKGYDKFSKIPAPRQKEEGPKTRKKENWFKKFLHSLSMSPKLDSHPSEINANICIIDSSLNAIDLSRVIKNQLELKKIEGSISEVDIDEEFGLINGAIPSRFSYGRKLRFKIEIIDLQDSSSLYITKLRGSDRGFRNLVNIVKLVTKQEEAANRTSRYSTYR